MFRESNKFHNSQYVAIAQTQGVRMLIDNYVNTYGYEVFEPNTYEGGVYAVADKEQGIILTLMSDGTVLKTDGFGVAKGKLTNGEVKLAEMDFNSAKIAIANKKMSKMD